MDAQTASRNGHSPIPVPSAYVELERSNEALKVELTAANAARTAAERNAIGQTILSMVYLALLAAVVVAYLFD